MCTAAAVLANFSTFHTIGASKAARSLDALSFSPPPQLDAETSFPTGKNCTRAKNCILALYFWLCKAYLVFMWGKMLLVQIILVVLTSYAIRRTHLKIQNCPSINKFTHHSLVWFSQVKKWNRLMNSSLVIIYTPFFHDIFIVYTVRSVLDCCVLFLECFFAIRVWFQRSTYSKWRCKMFCGG